MPSVVISQSRFDGGEIGPEIEARDDSGKRRAGLAQLKNGYGGFGGAVKKRPGLQYVGQSPSSRDRPRTWSWTGARGEPDFLMHFHPSPFSTDDAAYLSMMTADGVWVNSYTIQNGAVQELVPGVDVTGWQVTQILGEDHLQINIARDDGVTAADTLPNSFPFIVAPGDLVGLTEDAEETANRVTGRTFYAANPTREDTFVRYHIYDQAGNPIVSGDSGITPNSPFTAPDTWVLNLVGEIELPWKWIDIWQNENNEDANNPGVKFVQSGDVMTCTHPTQPVHAIERIPVAELSEEDTRNAPRRESVDAVDDTTYAWRILPGDFSLRQMPPSNIKIKNYRPRARNEGFQSDAADYVDFAVTAVTEDLGESHPGLAASDSRFFQPENGKRDFLEGWRAGDTRFVAVNDAQAAILGFDTFADHPGFHIRTAPTTTDGDDIVDKFPPGTVCWIRGTLGTHGVEDYVFQVRSVRLAEPTTSDDRANLNSAVGGVPGTNRSERGFPGPWIVVHPEPTPEQYENIFSMRTPRDTGAPVGTIEGPEFTGDDSPPTSGTECLPLNDTPE